MGCTWFLSFYKSHRIRRVTFTSLFSSFEHFKFPLVPPCKYREHWIESTKKRPFRLSWDAWTLTVVSGVFQELSPTQDKSIAAWASYRSWIVCTWSMLTCWAGGCLSDSCPRAASMDDRKSCKMSAIAGGWSRRSRSSAN